MVCAKQVFTVLSAAFALVAAVLWLWSTFAKTNAEPPGDPSFSAPMKDKNGKEWNFLGTLHLQSRINAWAAAAASASAICQAVSLLLPSRT